MNYTNFLKKLEKYYFMYGKTVVAYAISMETATFTNQQTSQWYKGCGIKASVLNQPIFLVLHIQYIVPISMMLYCI